MKYFNNPLNIRSGSKWLGLRGNRNGFCEFKSPEYCIRAALFLLLRNYPIHGASYISECIARWAPPSENNTDDYIEFVFERMGISVDLKVVNLPPDSLYRLLSAMCWMESHYNLSRSVFDDGYRLFRF